MSTLQNPPPDLLSLPNEILANICAFAADNELFTCGKDWIRAVRLTCKQLYAPATEKLAKRYFTKIHVMVTRQSLQELVDICKHSHIGSHVQEVVLHPYRVEHGFLHTVQTEINSLATKRDLEGVMEARKLIDWYFGCLEDEIRLERSGDVRVLFKQAFSALRVCQRPIKLTVTTREAYDVLFGYRQRRDSRVSTGNLFPFLDTAYTHRNVSASLLGILEAASAAGCKIHPLRVRINTLQPTSWSGEPFNLPRKTVRAIQRLKSLELDIDETLPTVYTPDAILIATLSNLKNLERVIFCSNSRYVLDPQSWTLTCYISRAIATLESQALRRVWLREIVVFPEELLFMLTKHKCTLKELTMSNVLLAGPWDEVLLSIKDNLRLDKLVMINLFAVDKDELDNDGRSAQIVPWLKGGFELHGQGKVMSGIDEVLDKWDKQTVDPDHNPTWRSAIGMGHLAYPED